LPTPLENGRVDFAWSPGELSVILGFDIPFRGKTTLIRLSS